MIAADRRKVLKIAGTKGFATNVDEQDLKENFYLRMRGLRSETEGFVAERDFGTKHRYSSYPTGITIVDGTVLNVPASSAEYDIVAGYDSSGRLRLFVYDSAWIELTKYYTGIVTAISTNSLTVGTLADSDAVAVPDGAFSIANYLVYSEASGYAALVVSAAAASGASSVITTLNETAITVASGGHGFAIGDTVYIYRETGILPDTAYKPTPTVNLRGYQFLNGTSPHIRWNQIDFQRKVNMYYGDGTIANARQPIQIRKGRRLGVNSFSVGGASDWANITHAYGSVQFNATWAIEDTSVNYFWAVYGSSVVYSQDGGTNWLAGVVPAGTQTLRGIQMLSLTVGYAWGDTGTVIKTTDGGANWSSVSTATIGTTSLRGGFFFTSPADTGYLCGNAGPVGKVFKTANAGSTWTQQTTPGGVAVYRSMSFIEGDADKGLVVGDNTLAAIAIYTTNGGTAWTSCTGLPTGLTPFGTTEKAYDVAMLSATSAILVVQGYNPSLPLQKMGKVYATTGSLAAFTLRNGFDIDRWPTGLKMSSATAGRLCGYDTVTGNGIVYVTADAGFTWTEERLPTSSVRLWDITFLTGDTAKWFAVGDSGGVKYLGGSPSSTGVPVAEGWTVQKAQLTPDFKAFGAINSYLQNSSLTQEIGDGFQIKVDSTPADEATSGEQWFLRIYVTVLYAEYNYDTYYQESDPIAKVYVRPAATDKHPNPKITVYVDPALVNKNVIGFNFYVARNDVNELAIDKWPENPKEAILLWTQLVYDKDNKGYDVGWTFNDQLRYAYAVEVNKFTNTLIEAASANINLLDALAHAPDEKREYLRPRYVAKAVRQQGSIVSVDQDDGILRFSTFDGYGVHQDDNFPDVSVDNFGFKQKLNLLPVAGELMGLVTHNDQILAFRPYTVEQIDLYSGVQRAYEADVLAKRSILNTPYGTFWAGNNAIYLFPSGRADIQVANIAWKNFFDGTLKATNGDQFISKANRQASIGGYDPTYHEYWLHVLCDDEAGTGTEYLCFRMNPEVGLWNVRKLNIGTNAAVAYFARDTTGMIIGYSAGLLNYPNRISANSLMYEDDVTSADVTASKGVITSATLHLGSVYALNTNVALLDILIDHTTLGTGSFDLTLFANAETTAFDTKTVPVNARPLKRRIVMRSRVDRARVAFGLSGTALTTVTKFNISQIEIGFAPDERLGNI